MRLTPKAVLLALAPILLVNLFAGAKDNSAAEMKPLMCKRGALLFSDDFSEGPVAKNWRAVKGQWDIAGGALKGVELKADNHAAAVRHAMNFHDAIFQFSFKLDGARMAAFMLNTKGGHVCRVILNPSGFALNKDGNPAKQEKAVALATVKTPLNAGQWYTMLVEVQGSQMLARIDDGHVGFGERAGINVDKNDFGMPVAGDSASFRNIRVWEALPNPDFNRDQFQPSTK
jgi:hypothetical protein